VQPVRELRALVRPARPSQWIKNGLVLVPLVFGRKILDPEAVWAAVQAFAAFSLAASAGYVLNDLHDVEADRHHPEKRSRPLASGAVSAGGARALAAALAATSLALAAGLGLASLAIVVGYMALSLAYTFALRGLVILDVMAIGALFILRVEGGAVAAGVPASHWLLIATGLLALFLGLGKRRHELQLLGEAAAAHRKALGAYGVRFLDQAVSLTTATALITYLLYALAPETVAYVGSRGMLLGAPFALYGLLRYLHLIYDAERGGDPTETLIRDPGIVGAVIGFVLVSGWVLY